MKYIWIVAVPALLSAGLTKASDVTETNGMPVHFRNLMDVQGYAIKQSAFNLPKHDTNSPRNTQWVERTRFVPFEIPKKKEGWKLWNNSSIRHVGPTDAEGNLFSRSLARYEYDITYTFEF
jgi:hypothetical protein